MKKPFFSIGMIFKNEIRCLERCLKSLQKLRDAVPCELIMADTGSSDGSREVAEQYADVVFDFPWVDDFAAARNAVMDRCSGKWYFSVDADEWLGEDIAELVHFSRMKKFPQDFAGVRMRNYKEASLEKSQFYVDFTATRLARLATGVRYRDCIHEKWTGPNGEPLVIMILSDTLMHHDGYVYETAAASKAKHDRNMALLKKKLEANPKSMQTLLECIDSTRSDTGEECVEYVERAITGIEERWPEWEKFGPIVFRNAVNVARSHELPQLWDWIDQAVTLFPDSSFVCIDVAFYAFTSAWDKKDYAGCARWGEAYRGSLKKYREGKFDISETLRGVIECESPYWETRLLILLSEAYLNKNEPENAYTVFRDINGARLDDLDNVATCASILMRLHRTTLLDTSALLTGFWDQIRQPVPDEAFAEQRRAAFLRRTADAFTTKYRADEEQREGFLRHGSSMLSALEDECPFGIAAAVMETDDAAVIAEKLARIEDWSETPVQSLSHALECGVQYPLPGKPLKIEQMDALASRLSKEKGRFFALFQRSVDADFSQDPQVLCWIRGLTLAALEICEWQDQKVDAVLDLGISPPFKWDDSMRLGLARTFARVEAALLPRCYAAEALTAENLFLLPPVHRFGFYYTQAFDALEHGDSIGYVRLLREALKEYEGMKPMAEFLIDHTPELQPAAPPSEELKALAGQIRSVLSMYAPDDPAVTLLKQSEAYRKVAYLIEGMAVPVAGGLAQ